MNSVEVEVEDFEVVEEVSIEAAVEVVEVVAVSARIKVPLSRWSPSVHSATSAAIRLSSRRFLSASR